MALEKICDARKEIKDRISEPSELFQSNMTLMLRNTVKIKMLGQSHTANEEHIETCSVS